MTEKFRAAITAFGIAGAFVIIAAATVNGPAAAAVHAQFRDAGTADASGIRLAGLDRVLADDDSCTDGSLQGSYYCSQQSGSQSQTTQDVPDTYTPSKPAFGYGDLPQCSAGSSAIAGALSGDGCS